MKSAYNIYYTRQSHQVEVYLKCVEKYWNRRNVWSNAMTDVTHIYIILEQSAHWKSNYAVLQIEKENYK